MERYAEFYCLTWNHYRNKATSVIIHDAKNRPRRICAECHQAREGREEQKKLAGLAEEHDATKL